MKPMKVQLAGDRINLSSTTSNHGTSRRKEFIIMDYFSTEFIFACGIIVGVALAIAVQSLWHDVFAGQHGTTKRRCH